ncbi:hypothetical protein V8E51_002958 [Hyaloscypha variabilis]
MLTRDTSSEPTSFVTIIVGDGQDSTPFTLHERRLCFYSPVFAKAFNGTTPEAASRTMKLDDIEVSVFGLLLFWIYSAAIPRRELQNEDKDTIPQTPTQLSKLWVLAQRFHMPKLQNEIIHEIFSAVDSLKNLESLQYTGQTPYDVMKDFVQFAYSTNSFVLKSLAVDRIAWGCEKELFMDIVGDLPYEAVVAIAKAQKTGCELSVEEFYCAED